MRKIKKGIVALSILSISSILFTNSINLQGYVHAESPASKFLIAGGLEEVDDEKIELDFDIEILPERDQKTVQLTQSMVKLQKKKSQLLSKIEFLLENIIDTIEFDFTLASKWIDELSRINYENQFEKEETLTEIGLTYLYGIGDIVPDEEFIDEITKLDNEMNNTIQNIETLIAKVDVLTEKTAIGRIDILFSMDRDTLKLFLYNNASFKHKKTDMIKKEYIEQLKAYDKVIAILNLKVIETKDEPITNLRDYLQECMDTWGLDFKKVMEEFEKELNKRIQIMDNPNLA